MAIFYFDASAVVKYFHREPGTTWIRFIADQTTNEGHRANQIYLAEISRVEVPAAFAILARTQQISIRVRDLMYDAFLQKLESEFQSLRLTSKIIRHAAELTQKYPLKAYDAIQLAVALELNAKLQPYTLLATFVSGDDNQLQAARAEGLVTENPFDHE
ncbi:MAG: type II toxin-antitoxin system VapC family toxin [Anaerolineae bacterium]|nr:type II toxin-antitoxin system VapC family toxin [Anaerolineae bacterium]